MIEIVSDDISLGRFLCWSTASLRVISVCRG